MLPLPLKEDRIVKQVTCDCGWRCRGTEEEVIAQVQAHARQAHRSELTRDQVLAVAIDAAPGTP